MADSLGIKFLETSAKASSNVENAFFTMSNEIRSNVQQNDDTDHKDKKMNLQAGHNLNKQGGCC